MKILKTIGITLLVIIVLLLVVALFLPSQVHVERSIVIKAEPAAIFSQLDTLKNWEKWSPWLKKDPSTKLSYEGPAFGKGAKYSWKGDKLGSGTLCITEAMPDSILLNTMEFGGMGKSNSSFKLQKTADGTKVTWDMDSKSENMPWYLRLPSHYFFLSMDGMIGPDYEAGLKNLKEIAEKMPAPMVLPEVKPEEVTTNDQKAIMINVSCTKVDVAAKFGDAMGKLAKYAAKNHAKMTGPPFAVYHHWQHDSFIFDACAPIDKKLKGEGDIKYSDMKGRKALKTDYHGSYMNMEPTYMSIEKWMKENNKKANGDSWEVYVTDPQKEKDTAQWLTEIYYPMP